MILRRAVIFSACLLLNLSLVTAVKAEEIVIEVSGNGSESNNEVNVQSQAATTVAQNNNAEISNSVNSNADTGGNSANSNTNGDTQITTGGANTTTSINNQNINSNVANEGACNCSHTTNVEVSGNGAGSDNKTYVTHNGSTYVNQTNNARITNNIIVNANTGYNKASYNTGGSSTIITGAIYAKTNVSNKNINNSFNSIDSALGSSSVVIMSNGEGSDTNVVVNQANDIEINVVNIADIINNIEHILNTGGNETLNNLGDSVIITGGIESDVTVENENINSSYSEVDCECDDPSVPQTPSQPTNPTAPNGGTSIVQGTSGSTGSAGTSGSSLPKTGLTIPLTFVATLIFIFMFLSGLYLRFSSSKSPPTI